MTPYRSLILKAKKAAKQATVMISRTTTRKSGLSFFDRMYFQAFAAPVCIF
jgi:hypothetical protein